MNSVELEWRVRRLSKMSASEVRWRISDHVRRRLWASRQVMPEVSSQSWTPRPDRHGMLPWASAQDLQFRTLPSHEMLPAVPDEARRRVIAAAEEVLAGRWELLGSVRQDMEDPDWFFDPVTGKRAPQFDYCFKVNHRSEDVTGNVKQIWELSRMHHVTVLAAAFASPATSATPNAPLSSPLVVGTEPVPLRRALDERDRGRAAADHLGLGAASARRLGRSSRAVRAQRGGPCPDLVAPALPLHPSAAGGRRPTIT